MSRSKFRNTRSKTLNPKGVHRSVRRAAAVAVFRYSTLTMQPEKVLSNISVVLVDTAGGANLGSAARAMKNMALTRLKLVNPREYMSSECRMMAGRAIELLTSAEVYSSLDEALVEEQLVVGTTSTRGRKQKRVINTPREMASTLREYAHSQRVALVFGPERIGLTDAQLARCQRLVSIPASPEYPVLNLAQAVMIVAYEIFTAASETVKQRPQLASDEQRERMFRQMERVLIDIGFLNARNPHPIMRSIRRFLVRADLTPREVRILRGIVSQMEWYVERGVNLPPEKVRKS